MNTIHLDVTTIGRTCGVEPVGARTLAVVFAASSSLSLLVVVLILIRLTGGS